MFCQINRNTDDNTIVSVNAANGAKSLLYEDLLATTSVDTYKYDTFARGLIQSSKVIMQSTKKEQLKEVALIEWFRANAKYRGSGQHYDANGEVKFSSLLLENVPVTKSEVNIADRPYEINLPNEKDFNTPLAKTARELSNALGITVRYINEQTAREILSRYNLRLDNRTSFTLNNEAYIIHERADLATLIHELFHPIIEVIAATNPALFSGLKKQITQEMYEQAKKNTVNSDNEDDVFKEAMATYVGDYVRNNKLNVKRATFLERVFSFLSTLFSVLKGSPVTITKDSTLEDIANSILSGTKQFDMNGYILTADKVFFETRKNSPIFENLKSQSSSLTRSEDFKTYKSGTKEYVSVGTVIDKFANIERGDVSIGVAKAIRYWDKLGIPHETKLNVSDYPHLSLTYDEYVKKKDADIKIAVEKGRILHLYREWKLATTDVKRAEISNKIQELAASIGITHVEEAYGWSIDEAYGEDKINLFKMITELEGTNIGNKNVLPALKDHVATEVQVFSDILGWAGTIDNLIESHDGKLSIIDLTTGRTYSSDYAGKIMKFGEQVKHITNNPENRKKLQIMLYALIIKAQNPDAQFRHLKVHWMPNRFEAIKESQDMSVDIASFLGMIEDYIRFEMPTVYDNLVQASPKIFDVTEYGAPNRATLDEMEKDLAKGLTAEEYIEKLQTELTRMTNRLQMYNELQQKNFRLEKDITRLTKKIMELQRNPAMLGLDNGRPDESWWKKSFGMFGDFADKKLQSFKLFMNQRRSSSDMEKAVLRQQLDTITTELKKEYLSRTGKSILNIASFGQVNGISYDDLYGKMIVPKNVGENAQRYVLVNEKAHPERWAELTATEKKFVKFIATKMKSFNTRVFMQNGNERVAYESLYNSKPVTYLSIVNGVEKSTEDEDMRFSLNDETFLPKVPMLMEEIIERFGLSKAAAKEYAKDIHNSFIENSYVKKEHDIGFPLRYFSTLQIDTADKFTHNLEHAFLAFSENMIDKYYMDDVLSLGKGIILIYMHDVDPEGNVKQKNNLSFLEDRLLIDILNKPDNSPDSRTGFRIPGTNKKLNIAGIARMLSKLTSAQIMWIKPIQGTANGAMAGMITTRRALVTSILGEGAFGLKDTKAGIAATLELTKDAALGNIRNNKLFQLAKMLNYMPSDFGYNTPSSDLTTGKNPGLSMSSFYMFHTGPEKFNSLVILAAQLHRMKTTVNGVETSMYDAYKLVEKTDPETGVVYKTVEYVGDTRGLVKEGQVTKELRELTSDEIGKLKRVYEKMQGGYRPDEKTTMELYWYGKLMLQFKKYMPSIVMNAMKSKTEDYTLGSYKLIERKDGQDVYEWVAASTEGSFRILGKALVALVTLGAKEREYYIFGGEMDIQRKEVLTDAALVMLSAMAAIAMLLHMYPDDDDAKDELNLLLWRVLENYSQHYNPMDWARSLTPPAAISRTFRTTQAFWQMTLAMRELGFGDPDNAYTRYGRIKGGTEIIKSIPILASIYAFHKFIGKADVTEEGMVATWFDANWNLAR